MYGSTLVDSTFQAFLNYIQHIYSEEFRRFSIECCEAKASMRNQPQKCITMFCWATQMCPKNRWGCKIITLSNRNPTKFIFQPLLLSRCVFIIRFPVCVLNVITLIPSKRINSVHSMVATVESYRQLLNRLDISCVQLHRNVSKLNFTGSSIKNFL